LSKDLSMTLRVRSHSDMSKHLEEIALSISSRRGMSRTAGTIEFKKDTGPVRRDIRVKDFDWSPDCLRDIARVLWSVQRSHSYAMSAYRLFSKIPSSKFSPDGLLGGKGYIQSIKEMRNGLSQAVEFLSSCTDTIHDEVNAEHWKMSGEVPEDINNIVEKSEEIKANPEEFVEQEYDSDFGTSPDEDNFSESDSEEDSSNENPSADDMNPEVEEDDEDDDMYNDPFVVTSSKKEDPLPTDESEQEEGLSESEAYMHTNISTSGKYSESIKKFLRSIPRKASSSIPQSTLPGPRVEHIGPGMNGDPEWGSDDPNGDDLFSGPNMTVPTYENESQNRFNEHDDSLTNSPIYLAVASSISSQNYHSWLPGSYNGKTPNIYGLNSGDVDLESFEDDLLPDEIGVEKDSPGDLDLWSKDLWEIRRLKTLVLVLMRDIPRTPWISRILRFLPCPVLTILLSLLKKITQYLDLTILVR
jgi:hypothetical protein